MPPTIVLLSTYLFANNVAGGFIKGTLVSDANYIPTTSYQWNGSAGGLSGNGTSWMLPNKTLLKIETSDCTFSTKTSMCGIILYTSGYQKKLADNKLVTGRDVFKLNVTNLGEVIPEGLVPGGTSWSTENNCDDSSIDKGTASGIGCAGRIAAKGWKADY